MAESKIYVVECGEGEWDDHVSWVERAFRRKEDAEAYAKHLDDEHNVPATVPDDLWNEAYHAWCESQEEQYGEDWEVGPFDFKTQREQYDAYQYELEEKERQFKLDYCNARSPRQLTINDIKQQELYEDNQPRHWDFCSINEIVLEE